MGYSQILQEQNEWVEPKNRWGNDEQRLEAFRKFWDERLVYNKLCELAVLPDFRVGLKNCWDTTLSKGTANWWVTDTKGNLKHRHSATMGLKNPATWCYYKEMTPWPDVIHNDMLVTMKYRY